MAYESMSFAVGFNAEYGGIQNSLFHVQKKLDKTMEKLSTGQRINDMKDDEGGKAIADTMKSWKSGTDESIQNLKEFLTMTKIAEKALNDMQDILFEMKQTIDRLNGIETATDRSAATSQLRELAMAINKIAEHTEYKGRKLFNMDTNGDAGVYLEHTLKGETSKTIKNYSDRFIRYGAGAEDVLSWDLGMDPRAQQLGMVMGAKIDLSSSGGVKIENLYLNGRNVKQIADQNGIDTTTDEGIIQAVKLALGENVKVDFVTSNSTSGNVKYLYIQTPGDFVYGLKTSDGKVEQHVISSVAFTTYEKGLTGALPSSSSGSRIESAKISSSGAVSGAAVIGASSGNSTSDDDLSNVGKYTGVISNRQTAIYFPNVDNDDLDAAPGSSGKPLATVANEGLFDINVMSNENAALARVQVEAAIIQIDELRGVVAAMQHQAESLINQRMEESVAAEAQISHIMDTDYAKELAEFTKQQIAQQAGVNMLAQKRQAAQLITQLLR